MSDVATFSLRPAAAGDSQFCLRLHEAVMRPYVEPVWGWDECLQRSYHDRWFDPARLQIIVVDGCDAGVLDVDRYEDHIYLGRIELLPAYQGRGVGARLIGQLLDEAGRRRQPVTLEVLEPNHRARALYERLGFSVVGRHDDNVTIAMRADPALGVSRDRR